MGAEEALIKRIISRFRCSGCNRHHLPSRVDVMDTYDDVWIIGVNCDYCEQPGMYVVSLRKDSSLDQVTDLTDEEQERFLGGAMVEADDVESIRAFLAEFKGNFSGIFGKSS